MEYFSYFFLNGISGIFLKKDKSLIGLQVYVTVRYILIRAWGMFLSREAQVKF